MLFINRVSRSTAILAFALVIGSNAIACECVSPSGQPVTMGDQTNIVIWDAKSHTEHFVRDAKFRSDAKDFGFIAPTPSKPELSEASPQAFNTLAALKPTKSDEGFAKALDAPPGKVQVVQQVDLAGYRATTLLATDSASLAEWMRSNGYQTTRASQKWTETYIAKGWYLTAFKVLKKNQQASTGTVRMSFHADQPFNPYYVPSDNIKEGRKGTLRVYFVAAGTYSATVGKSDPWKGAVWSSPLSSEVAGRLATQLKLQSSEIPAGSSVEAFEDHDFPKAASDDIYFQSESPKGKSLEVNSPSESGQGIAIPVGVGALAFAGIAAWIWLRSPRVRDA